MQRGELYFQSVMVREYTMGCAVDTTDCDRGWSLGRRCRDAVVRRLVLLKSMPYKLNESRRHKILKAKCRVGSRPDCDAALVRRGSLTVWITEEGIVT
jgi:hypothetical protein